MPSNRCSVSVAMILACAAGSAQGIIRSWTLTTGGSYSTPTNWQPTGLPAPDDNLIFDVQLQRLIGSGAPKIGSEHPRLLRMRDSWCSATQQQNHAKLFHVAHPT